MSTVISKLRHFSEQRQISHHHITRAASGLIFAAYFYKFGSPLVGQVVRKVQSKAVSLQERITGLDSFADEPDEQQQQSVDANHSGNRRTRGDRSLSTSSHKHRKNRDPREDYTQFGIRDGSFTDFFVDFVVKTLRQFQSITGIDVTFAIQLIKLIRIMVPGVRTLEVLLLILHTMALISRTFLSIFVANLEGQVVKYIVRRDVVNFTSMLSQWLLIAVPATFINSSIRFLENQLALAFRTRLVRYGYELYFRNQTYYSVSNLDGRLENPDHCLTDDLISFSQHCAHLYSSVTKPLLDLFLTTYTLLKMSKKMGSYGGSGQLIAAIAIMSTHGILRLVSPKFGSLVSEEARRKGFLRSVHARVITNAEEIAFYGGHQIELKIVQKAYKRLAQQMNVIYNQRWWYIMFEQFLMKYVWSAIGMINIALPVMTSSSCIKMDSSTNSRGDNNDDISERTQYMTTAKNILIAGGDAAERLMSSYKELIELTGYTKRVAKMFTVFEEVSQGKYKKVVTESIRRRGALNDHLKYGKDGSIETRGEIVEVDDHIELFEVPIITPNCDIIVPSLSLKITKQMHLLITGPNGCGKSSLFRMLAGLWPIFGGKLERPKTKDMFYIPQRPYMSLGTLRDQIIYPDSVEDMKRNGITDDDLIKILDLVELDYLVKSHEGLNRRSDWKDTLSGGEKQRIGTGRLYYHRPKFALLDECTSAVSIDVESKMYQTIKDYGISLVTITHRPSLWKFHTHLLQFDGVGGWRLEPLDTNARLSLREEKLKLEEQLEGVPKMQERLLKLCSILGEDSIRLINHKNGNSDEEHSTDSSTPKSEEATDASDSHSHASNESNFSDCFDH
ncbi:ATP binding cassette subfamily D [Brevipalpus obovatus]|uniref:ATP binding cassette subfamily D n=1 Tax=Brevipalpus obovatus TaxID=246614 RepID=UPI003D9F3E97